MKFNYHNIFKNVAYSFLLLAVRTLPFVHSPKNSAIILMYHTFDDTAWKYGVRPKNLERQLSYLTKSRHVVPLADVVAFVNGTKEIPRNSVAITVDDVYEDTYSVLFPLLKKHNIPVTLFLTTELSPQEKLGNLPRPTWEQLREMQKSGLVTVEVHGQTHTNWPLLTSDKELAKEIIGARDVIKEHLGYYSRFAAYPAGRRDSRVTQYLLAWGFDAAVTITEGPVYVGDDPLNLRRVQVDKSTSMIIFKSRVSPEIFQPLHMLRSFMRWS